MIRWLLYLLPAIFATIICYLTNPIVVLFCDEEGELPGLLHMWQTWDDSCDSEFYMKNVVPSWLDYGYDEHYFSYRDTDIWSAKYDKQRQFSVLHPCVDWTAKQRLQRYICRVLWLYRNCAYGWLFYYLGADMTNIKWHIQEDRHFFGSIGSWLTEPFCYKDERRINKYLSYKIYLGWKTFPNNAGPQRCMLAYRCFLKLEV